MTLLYVLHPTIFLLHRNSFARSSEISSSHSGSLGFVVLNGGFDSVFREKRAMYYQDISK